MKIELRKVKFHEDMSDETNCFSADVWADGKLVAYAENRGCGGDTNVTAVIHAHDGQRPTRAPGYDEFRDHCLALPPTKHDLDGYKFEVKSTPSSVVDDLFEEWLKGYCEKKEAAQIKRWCKTKTVYRLKGDPEGSWLTIKAPFSSRVREHIRAKYGDRVEEIANERFQTA